MGWTQDGRRAVSDFIAVFDEFDAWGSYRFVQSAQTNNIVRKWPSWCWRCWQSGCSATAERCGST